MSKELKDWLEEQRNAALGKMAANIDNPALKNYYEGISDGYMAALIHIAVNAKDN
jgi:hypothetical protein